MSYGQGVGFWDGRRTLVTGAGGFIGGHLAVALTQAGASVRGLCRYNSRGDRGTLDWCPKEATDGIEVQFGDLRDPESIQRAMQGVEVAFHLGAQVAIPYSYLNPRDFFETNVGGTLNVAQAALAADVGRVVHLSTSEIYGAATAFPITEQAVAAPRSPYAASKVGADAVMAGWHASFGLPVVTARPFNTYGPRQSARAIVPTIIAQALSGAAVHLGSLHPRRDLTFVSDTVSGLIATAVAGDEVLGRTLQLGSAKDVSIGELAALVGELTGHELEVVLDPERVRPATSEVSRLVCDHSLMTKLTGWTPAVDLRTGVRHTLDWISVNTHRYRPSDYAR
jgi:NAD dependent epimerase/dehydratase